MKLRIRGNSLRLRLAKSEVTQLLESSRVADHVSLSLSDQWDRLSYAVEHSDQTTAIGISHIGNEIRVEIPTREVRKWASGELVGMYGVVPVFGGQTLSLVVEKDFACLDKSDADNLDTFPNPSMTC